jgi:diguanylate cyclase (GGDEF)-like protein/PAS domain S-box-containing protein
MRNKKAKRLMFYVLLVAGIWTGIIVASLMWNIEQVKMQTIAKAEVMAYLAFDKDASFRTWATFHGGVYVPITAETKPNPYLNVPDRDAETRSGKPLTLMNPAYMMRQFYEGFEKKDGVKGHITSLKPLRPNNTPDPWEEKSLKAFEQGKKETMTIQMIDGTEYVRLMRPFIVTKGCLKCHSEQGYSEGDIRGGISTSVPMAPLRLLEKNRIVTFIGIHTLFWFIGIGGIAIFGRQIIKREKRRNEAEEKFSKAFRASPDWVTIATIKDGRYLDINEAFVGLTGYSREEAIGKTSVELGLWVNPNQRREAMEKINRYGSFHNYEVDLRMRSGTILTMLWSAEQIEIGGESCIINVIKDITERKNIEEALKKERQHFLTLTEDAPFGIIVVEKDGTFTYVNEKFHELFGYTLEDIPNGKEWLCKAFPDEDDRQTVITTWLEDAKELKKSEQKPRIFTITCKDHSRKIINFISVQLDTGITLVTCEDITERVQAEETIRHMAYHDILTGLPNRKLFFDRLAMAMARADRNQGKVAVMMFDLDKFKDVNDNYGHDTGDLLLKDSAKRLADVLRKIDTVARFGGDEFVLILPELKDVHGATRAADKIVESFRKTFFLNGHSLSVTTSIGISMYPDDGQDTDNLVKNADTAMYKAKQAGRNRYQFYTQ